MSVCARFLISAAFALSGAFVAEAKPGGYLGEADDKGVFHRTAAAEQAAMSEKEKAEASGKAEAERARAKAAGWGTEPLGPTERKLNPSPELKQKPVFRKRPRYPQGLKVAGPGTRLVIFHEGGRASTWQEKDRAKERVNLANELKWHIEKMCAGARVEVRAWDPQKPKAEPSPSETTVIFAEREMAKKFFGLDFSAHPTGTSFLKRKGNWFLIGGDGSGRSHALTYLLETMGCRYLWPSEDHHGKIVPTGAKEVRFPELDWTYTPAMKVRGVRTYFPKKPKYVKDWGEKCPLWLGVGAEEFLDRWMKSREDEGAGNRDFWAWHGVSDQNSLPGEYKWGHAFTEYWKMYGTNGTRGEHLEFFGLQSDGSRDQGPKLGSHTDRATLCLSNRGLIEETAKNICEQFRAKPEFHALSIALNDGGPCAQCMCENCRRLDPVCARKRPTSYPRLTDRVMYFNNEVAALVKKEFPEKKLCFQAYADWTGVPVCVPPNDSLAVYAVVGDYSQSTNVALSTMAAWSNFGVETFWRPNLLMAFRTVAPQNLSRWLFRDLELAKANHCVGTDFDCYYDRWSQSGATYYALASAMLNFDSLTYDDIMDDYFRAGFGPAAPAMKRYWQILEDTFVKAVAERKSAKEVRGFYSYQRVLDLAPLEVCFAEAKRLAAGDGLILRRIAFFESALPLARIEKRIVEAYDRDDLAANEAAVREYYAWVRENSLKDLPSNTPDALMTLFFSPCVNWLEWSKKPGTKVRFDEEHYNEFYRK